PAVADGSDAARARRIPRQDGETVRSGKSGSFKAWQKVAAFARTRDLHPAFWRMRLHVRYFGRPSSSLSNFWKSTEASSGAKSLPRRFAMSLKPAATAACSASTASRLWVADSSFRLDSANFGSAAARAAAWARKRAAWTRSTLGLKGNSRKPRAARA